MCFFNILVSYCYFISTRIKSGDFRLLSLLPVCAMFLVLPLFLSSAHFCFSTTTFLSWLANFKLILFAFDLGPLSPLPPNISQFICYTFFTCFPIKPQRNPKSQHRFAKFLFAIKAVIFALVLHLYDDRQNIPQILLLVLYHLHLYLALVISFWLIKVVVSITLSCELEPPFNEPYLATSLRDFWGRRWNLIVSGSLRSGVYVPVRRVAERFMSSDLAMLLGFFALLHEMIFFYLTLETPTWEVTWLFLLHGVCTVAEVAVKRTGFVRRWRVIPLVSRILTVGFVFLTGGWLFFPQFKRGGVMERFAGEALLVIDFVKRKSWFVVVVGDNIR